MPRCARSSRWSSPRRLLVLSAEWAAAGARRLSVWARQFVLLGMLVVGSAIIFSEALWDGPAESREGAASSAGIEPVEGVAFSPDGKTLASCGWDSAVRIWALGRLREARPSEPVVLPHRSVRHAVAFSADGSLLAAAGEKSLTIWSCKSGRFTPLLDEEIETSHCLAFSPDGRALAIGTDDGSIRIWEMPGGHERAILKGHNAVVRSVAFSADARRLVSTSESRSIMLWDAIQGNLIRPLELHRQGSNVVLFAAFSTDGRHVAIGEVSGNPEEITLIDSESGEVRNRLSGHNTGVQALAFSPDGRTLATAGLDNSIKLWDWTQGKEVTTLSDGVGFVKSLAFSHDGLWLAFAGNDDSVRIWDVPHRRSLLVGRFSRPSSDSGTDMLRGPSPNPNLTMAILNRGFSS
jgi:WD40 repeat protein